MLSNPKPSTKPRAQNPARAVTLAISEDGDDGDDFQNPSEAFSFAQSLLLSSLGNPRSEPLKPSNATRPKKKRAKPAPAPGKENRAVSKTLEVDSRISGEVLREATDRRDIFCFASDDRVKDEETVVRASFESRIEGYGRIRESGIGNKEENSLLITSTASKLADDEEKQGSKCEIPKGSYYMMSIESRLLEPRANSISCRNGGDLNREASVLERSNLDVAASELLWSDGVECPLCGLDISDLSEEQRQIHTNDCLDKDGTSGAIHSVSEAKSTLPQGNVDTSPVIEFLRSLGLSRYEQVFVREEIDWETLQWLTEEDLLNIGIDAFGPRKKIICALNELRKRHCHAEDVDTNSSNQITNECTKFSSGNKLITEYFRGSVIDTNRICTISKPPGMKSQRNSAIKRGRKCVNIGKVRDIPPWCCIPGTPFRVDAFRYLRGDCSHWFLTHFHIDHYQGLTRHFCHGKIYCSSITARLINLKIGVPGDRLQVLPLNQKITVAGVSLTCFDANHCPGSIIILFEPPNGKAVLHTGDFRFSSEMASNSALQSCRIHTLILDTTYCNPQYDFPKQEVVIQFVIEAIQAESFNPKTLFLIGSYTIGKERVFLEVARLLRKKVFVGSAKLHLLRCLEFREEDMQWFTENEMESHIHVVPMWTLASFKRMKYISNQYAGRFDLIVAFSPTGWSFGKGKRKTPGRRWQQGTIIRYEVPYSEHCSFTELREFVRFVSPDHIIPSVNNDGPESADAMLALLTSDS
uniref:SAM domain-containing protein n=1 Tax=Ananas comosus var. bracteatus TaxID=296719 RepID=A0A6V7P5G5_ANACO|nr:unnamed protein product [Ananas comosus var. bracteatus]